MGLAGALLVNSEFRGRSWFRTLFLIPYALPVYVAVIAWSFMLERDNGSLNALLVNDLHLVDRRPFWLLGTNAFWSVVMTTVWRLWPFAFLMILAGLQNIPRELYEAAALDGASPCGSCATSRCRSCGRSPACSCSCCSCGRSTSSTRRTCCSGQSPPSAADLISLHIYVNSFVDLNFGLGAAMSVLLLVFLHGHDAPLPARRAGSEGARSMRRDAGRHAVARRRARDPQRS